MAHNSDGDRHNGGAGVGGVNAANLCVAPKRIIICCDGTWQSSVTNNVNVPSNVTRIARLLSRTGHDSSNKEWQQLVYYDAGIGTGVFDIEAKVQGGTGSGFIGNVIEAYNFIVLNYNPGDQIFCIGFSRGAYTARAVAGLVTDLGIVKPRDMQDFPELYNLYQAHTDSHMFRQTKEWREWVYGKPLPKMTKKGDVPKEWKSMSARYEKRPHEAPAESTRWVEAVGVFDTVGSLGIPKAEGAAGLFLRFLGRLVPCEKFGFHNVALSPYIKHAFHALALDERRKPFDATLWHLPADDIAAIPDKPDGSVAQLREKMMDLHNDPDAAENELDDAWHNLIAAEMHEELKDHKSELVQVWFPGVHINIGGGNDDLLKDKLGDFEQIAMITLHWMMSVLSPHLSFTELASEQANTDRILQMRAAVDDIIFSDDTSHWLMKKIQASIDNSKIFTPNMWDEDGVTLKRVVAMDALTGWATGPIIDSFHGLMTLADSKNRTPGEYRKSKLQDGRYVELGKTNEFIHPTVQYRKEHLPKDGYDPVALDKFERKEERGKVKQQDGSIKEVVVGFKWVKEDKTASVPEWKIPADSMERACVASPSSRAWLGALDQKIGVRSPLTMTLVAKS